MRNQKIRLLATRSGPILRHWTSKCFEVYGSDRLQLDTSCESGLCVGRHPCKNGDAEIGKRPLGGESPGSCEVTGDRPSCMGQEWEYPRQCPAQ